MNLVPKPIVMGMVAGVFLRFGLDLVRALQGNVAIAGPMVAVFVALSATRAGIIIVPLPAKCPELNPVENSWQFMRDNWLSNRVFQSYDAIVDHCCYAWNQLVDRPWRVMAIGLRDGATGHTQ